MRVEKRVYTINTQYVPRREPRMETITGYVSEIFCSVQGEGIYMGERQVFFRTAGCTATCNWCDTPASKVERKRCAVHAGKRTPLDNPLSVPQAVNATLAVADAFGPVRTVSLTGGEPLEQKEFLLEVTKSLRGQGAKIYLETSGLEVEGLRLLRPFVDVVSMDMKMPSATGESHWETHEKFVKWLVGKEFFVKVVVDDNTKIEEIAQAAKILAAADRNAPFILQPESAIFLGSSKGVEARRKISSLLDQGQRLAMKNLFNVRVIPQCHKVLKVR